MALSACTYGKGRVRVMRLSGEGQHRDVRELTIRAMVQGDIGRAYTDADNSTTVATDTIKNVVNVVAREELEAAPEAFCRAVARKLCSYQSITRATVSAREVRWNRLTIDGRAHMHSFTLDGNGHPTVEVVMDEAGDHVRSGLSDFTFTKATGSGWSNYVMDRYTTLPETEDRLLATSMEASWRWARDPDDFAAANARVLDRFMHVFSETFSFSAQDSLYRMAVAALEAVPEVGEVSIACPNKHYVPVNLAPFGLDNPNRVFTPTDEPHGQIECCVSR